MITITQLIAVLFQVLTIIGSSSDIPQSVKEDVISKVTSAISQQTGVSSTSSQSDAVSSAPASSQTTYTYGTINSTMDTIKATGYPSDPTLENLTSSDVNVTGITVDLKSNDFSQEDLSKVGASILPTYAHGEYNLPAFYPEQSRKSTHFKGSFHVSFSNLPQGNKNGVIEGEITGITTSSGTISLDSMQKRTFKITEIDGSAYTFGN